MAAPSSSTVSGSAAPTLGTMVAMATPVALLVAYFHEIGFGSVFGIPSSIITLQPPIVIGAFVVVLSTLVFPYNWVNIIYMGAGHRRNTVLGQRLEMVMWPVLLIITTGWIYHFGHLVEWILPGGCLLILAIYTEFLIPLQTQKRVPGYRAKLAAQDATDSRSGGSAFLLGRRFGQWMLLPVVTIGLCYFSYVTGRGEALTSDQHLISTSTGHALLRIYGDTTVMVVVDAKSKLATRTLVLQKLGGPLEFDQRDTGELVRDCFPLIGCH